MKQIPLLKKEYAFLKEADSTALRNAVTDLVNGFQKYFNKQASMPHFKKKGTKESYRTTCIRSSYKKTDYTNIKVDLLKKEITLPKLGILSIRAYQKLKNSRKKQAEEIVSKLVKENDIIFAEKLQVNKMIAVGTKRLRKNILHSTFSLILNKLHYQCIWQGK